MSVLELIQSLERRSEAGEPLDTKLGNLLMAESVPSRLQREKG